MSNYANINRLIGLRVQVHNTGHKEIDLEGEIDCAWVTQDDHIRVLLRQITGDGVDQWGEWMMEDLKLVKPGLNVSSDELSVAKTRKIEAIKMYRERTGSGLREAKDAIENAMAKTYGSTMTACGYCGSHTCFGNCQQQKVSVSALVCTKCGMIGHTFSNCTWK